MPRAKDGTLRKTHRKKMQKLAKGYWGRRKNLFRVTKDAIAKGLLYAYRDRKNKKRDFRKLWIARISAAVQEHGMTYSKFIHRMTQKNIHINRKILSNLAVTNRSEFNRIIESVK